MVAATLVLLFLMTGSIAIPVKAVVMNVLSLGASFGALVWVFQDGNLSGPLGFDPVGSIDLWLPSIIFLFAFGLSMDYEVFLLGRIKEIHDRTGDNDLSVSMGLQKTGRIITSAALLIVVVFAGFAAGETLTIKQLGIGLALAVIVDATVVRSLLVPATMKLLGEWNWWAPAPLRRLHARFGLAEPSDESQDHGSAPEPSDEYQGHGPVPEPVDGFDRVVPGDATGGRRELVEGLRHGSERPRVGTGVGGPRPRRPCLRRRAGPFVRWTAPGAHPLASLATRGARPRQLSAAPRTR